MTKRILVIDDDVSTLELLTDLFSENGYAVVTAKDGQFGFNRAVTENFDLIILDIRMPEWQGTDSIYGLTVVENKTPIIVISGYIDPELTQKLTEFENVHHILDKPIDISKLLRAVKALLDN